MWEREIRVGWDKGRACLTEEVTAGWPQKFRAVEIVPNDEHNKALVRKFKERRLKKLKRNKKQKVLFTCGNVRCTWVENSVKGR